MLVRSYEADVRALSGEMLWSVRATQQQVEASLHTFCKAEADFSSTMAANSCSE